MERPLLADPCGRVHSGSESVRRALRRRRRRGRRRMSQVALLELATQAFRKLDLRGSRVLGRRIHAWKGTVRFNLEHDTHCYAQGVPKTNFVEKTSDSRGSSRECPAQEGRRGKSLRNSWHAGTRAPENLRLGAALKALPVSRFGNV